MMTNQSFSILVWVKKSRLKNGISPLCMRITINKKRAEITTNRSIQPDLWDHKAQKVKGNSPAAKDINRHLEAIRTALHSHQSRLVTLGKIVTAQMLKNEYLGITTDRKSLCDAFDFLIKQYKEKLAKKLISETTVSKYEITYGYVKAFIKNQHKVTNIQLSDIKPLFIFLTRR